MREFTNRGAGFVVETGSGGPRWVGPQSTLVGDKWPRPIHLLLAEAIAAESRELQKYFVENSSEKGYFWAQNIWPITAGILGALSEAPSEN